MLLSIGQVPDQPAIHGAEGQLPCRGAFPGASHILQNPSDLAPRKIGIDQKPCTLLNHGFAPVRPQPLAKTCRTSILPNDSIVDSPARLTVPNNRRFALVCDSNGSDVTTTYIGL